LTRKFNGGTLAEAVFQSEVWAAPSATLAELGGELMRPLPVTFCLFLFGGAAFAQSDRSTITGAIFDPTGAVVGSAPIEAKNLATGVLYSAQGTATGNYTLAELPVGTYEVSVTVPGFKKYVRTGLAIQAAQIYRVDIILEVGSAS